MWLIQRGFRRASSSLSWLKSKEEEEQGSCRIYWVTAIRCDSATAIRCDSESGGWQDDDRKAIRVLAQRRMSSTIS